MKTFYSILVNSLVATIVNMFVWFAVTFWVFLQTRSVIATSIMASVCTTVFYPLHDKWSRRGSTWRLDRNRRRPRHRPGVHPFRLGWSDCHANGHENQFVSGISGVLSKARDAGNVSWRLTLVGKDS